MAAVCLVFGAMIFILMRSSYLESRGKLGPGRFEVVEGCVEDLHPMPVRGGELESFSVHGIKFTYSDYESTPGYNRTISHGGIIGKDLMVRISYATDNEISPPRNVILKLEISRNRTKCSAE